MVSSSVSELVAHCLCVFEVPMDHGGFASSRQATWRAGTDSVARWHTPSAGLKRPRPGRNSLFSFLLEFQQPNPRLGRRPRRFRVLVYTDGRAVLVHGQRRVIVVQSTTALRPRGRLAVPMSCLDLVPRKPEDSRGRQRRRPWRDRSAVFVRKSTKRFVLHQPQVS